MVINFSPNGPVLEAAPSSSYGSPEATINELGLANAYCVPILCLASADSRGIPSFNLSNV